MIHIFPSLPIRYVIQNYHSFFYCCSTFLPRLLIISRLASFISIFIQFVHVHQVAIMTSTAIHLRITFHPLRCSQRLSVIINFRSYFDFIMQRIFRIPTSRTLNKLLILKLKEKRIKKKNFTESSIRELFRLAVVVMDSGSSTHLMDIIICQLHAIQFQFLFL